MLGRLFRLRSPLVRSCGCRSLHQGWINQSKYSSEEQGIILGRLNNLNDETKNLLGERYSKSISHFIESNGALNNLEDLLLVSGIGPKVLRNVCAKLLDQKNEDKAKAKKIKRNKYNILNPDLNSSKLAAIKTVLAVHIDVKAISWALVDCHKKYLIDWRVMEMPSFIDDSSGGSLRILLDYINSIKDLIPKSDLYTLEDPGLQGSSYKIGISFQHLSCSFCSLLFSTREMAGEGTVALLRGRVLDRYFNSIIGNEVVSLQSHVNNMMLQQLHPTHSNLYIEPNLITYFREQDSFFREHLSRSCLLGVTIIDKFILKKPLKT